MNVIVCLARGYPTLDGYKELLDRNRAIRRCLTSYPHIVFHEGNIPLEHQEYIQQASELEMQFIDISSHWDASHPYESMCAFFAYHIWNYCRDYHAILRIDTDCLIKYRYGDPFSLLEDKVCLKSIDFAESHRLTNQTLSHCVPPGAYNYQFPYTNVFLSRVDFWLRPNINCLLKQLVETGTFKYRWGDMPILGCILNMMEARVGYLTDLVYCHISHDLMVYGGRYAVPAHLNDSPPK